MDDKTKQLQAPFQPQDIEWRSQQSGVKNGNPWTMVIPYITNRAIQKRLDEVFGVFGWENSFEQTTPTITKKKDAERTVYGWRCGITVYDGDKKVTRWDGAEETDIEPLKGGISNSMKRAAVQFGIGRYLYQLEPIFAQCTIVNSRCDCNEEYPNYGSAKEKNTTAWINFVWANPPLPTWALPGSDFDQFLKPVQEAETMTDLKSLFTTAYRQAESSGNSDNTETLIQAKDKRKSEIEKKLIEEREANLKTVTDWLKTQADSLNKIPNESATTAIYETIKVALKGKMKEFNLNPDHLLKSFKNSYDLRIKELQPKQKEERYDN